MNRYYYLSNAESFLLYLFDLKIFVKYIPDAVIPYSRIDELARVVYSRKIRSVFYKKLVSFVDRLEDILENNPDIC